jgi:hypothetical protein
MAIIRNTFLSYKEDLIFYLDALNVRSYPGGGSYVNPSAISNTITSGPGSNYGDGSVIITYIG